MTLDTNAIGQSCIDAAIASYRANKGWADKAIAQLPDDKLRVALDSNTNSIAVIMKHVAGNLLSRWTDFLTTDGEKPWRNRDDEFVDTFSSRAELIAYWDSGWQRLFDSLAALSPVDLSQTITIRGEPHTVPLAISRSLAHSCYHVGQIILIARILAGDHWTTITIPRGASASFNQKVWGSRSYRTTADTEAAVAQKQSVTSCRYSHTNIIATDWQRLAEFYQLVFGCEFVPPERNQSGKWLEDGTGVPGAALRGVHLRLPGCGASGPTLEVYSYRNMEEKPAALPNRKGFGHIAFAVDDVESTLAQIISCGGRAIGKVVSIEVPLAGKITFTYAADPEDNIIELQKWS